MLIIIRALILWVLGCKMTQIATQILNSEEDIIENECFLDSEHFDTCVDIIMSNVTAHLNSTDEGNDEILGKVKKKLNILSKGSNYAKDVKDCDVV